MKQIPGLLAMPIRLLSAERAVVDFERDIVRQHNLIWQMAEDSIAVANGRKWLPILEAKAEKARKELCELRAGRLGGTVSCSPS